MSKKKKKERKEDEEEGDEEREGRGDTEAAEDKTLLWQL